MTTSTRRAVYTHGHHESVLRSHSWRTAANSARYLLPRLRRGMSLLDVGCGPGTITADLAELVSPGSVTGVERSLGVLDIARRQAAGHSGGVDFVVSDVHALGFRDDAFDVVHAHQVLQHLADPVHALREMGRVCAPGGTVAVRDSDYAAFRWQPELPELDEWLHLYRTLARDNNGEPDAGRLLPRWVRDAGFTDVVATSSSWCFETPQDRQWWGRTWADRVVGSQLAEQAVSSGAASTADLTRIARGWLTWAAAADGWMKVPHQEVLARP
ncbi:MAG: methyltransferase domain-containing protein [Nocardioidaceae bacterium]